MNIEQCVDGIFGFPKSEEKEKLRKIIIEAFACINLVIGRKEQGKKESTGKPS